MVESLRSMERDVWLRSVPLAAVAALLIAIPSDLLDNPVFGRPIPPRPVDYVVLAVTSALIGLILAIRPPASPEAERQEVRTLWGGLVSFLAVGCPVCNQAVVALVGTSGALSWWAPIQPVLGFAAIALLIFTLRLRLRSNASASCPVPLLRS